MKTVVPFVLAGIAIAQQRGSVQQSSKDRCAVNIVGNNNHVVTCQGIDERSSRQMVALLNAILAKEPDPALLAQIQTVLGQVAANQLDSKIVIAKLDEIIKTSRVDPQDISKGVLLAVQQYQDNFNSPKASFIRTCQFLDGMIPSMEASFRRISSGAAVSKPGFRGARISSFSEYYAVSYRAFVQQSLETLQEQRIPVSDLLRLNAEVNSIEDVKKLADAMHALRDSL